LFTIRALQQVDAFITIHPDYTRRGVKQPGQGSTNRVVFARRGSEHVIFKVFCEPKRKERACFAFKHWQETRLVPKLIEDISSDMICISWIPGKYLAESHKDDPEYVWYEHVYATGKAIGSLTQVPINQYQIQVFESRYYHPLGEFSSYLNRIIELGWLIHARDVDFRGTFWSKNLRFIENQLPLILSQTRVLYHQDVSNLHVYHGNFMGFFDLEMCRIGCAAMQLGASLGMLEGNKDTWIWFRDGWEDCTGHKLSNRDCDAAAACYYLLGWREISRYMSYDGINGSGYTWASPADPRRYRAQFMSVKQMLGDQENRI
jgi:hypothetical protein